MSSRQSSLYCAARSFVLSMIPILTCTAVSAQSLSPRGAAVDAYRTGSSSHTGPGSGQSGTWQHTQTPSGTRTGYGGQPGWTPRQQASSGYGSNVPASNYGSREARPIWSRAPIGTRYETYIPATPPPRPPWHQRDSAYAGGASVLIYRDRETRAVWPPAPIEAQYGVVTPAPVEPQYSVVTPAPIEPQSGVVTPAPIEPQYSVVTPAPVEPQYSVVTPAPIEPQSGVVITRESVYPGWPSWQHGNWGHGSGAASIYESREARPVWTHAPTRPQYGGGTTSDSSHSGWSSSQQTNSGHGGNGSAANHGNHQAQSTWSQSSPHSQNVPVSTGNRVHAGPEGGAAGPGRVH